MSYSRTVVPPPPLPGVCGWLGFVPFFHRLNQSLGHVSFMHDFRRIYLAKLLQKMVFKLDFDDSKPRGAGVASGPFPKKNSPERALVAQA